MQLEAELFESSSSVSGEAAAVDIAARGRAVPAGKGRGGLKVRRQEKEQERLQKNVKGRAPKYIVMCGLAGAGKSTFCRTLESAGGWVRVNQDDLKRKGCLDLLSRTVPAVRQGRTKVVVDRCNVSRRDRGEVLDMLQAPPVREVVCIFFDFPAEDCKRRAAAREDHPTIRKGGGARIIDDQAKRLERPEVAEGFAAVEVVRSFADADALLRRYGVVLSDSAAKGVDSSQPADAEEPAGDVNKDVLVDAEPESGPKLPEVFTSWLRDSLRQELSAMDFEAVVMSVEVILENAGTDEMAIESAVEILQDCGAPECADSLADQWRVAMGTSS